MKVKEPLKLDKITLSVVFADDHYNYHQASIEIPLEAGPSTVEEAMKGAVSMLHEAAHNRFIAAKDERQAEIAKETAANEAFEAPSVVKEGVPF